MSFPLARSEAATLPGLLQGVEFADRPLLRNFSRVQSLAAKRRTLRPRKVPLEGNLGPLTTKYTKGEQNCGTVTWRKPWIPSPYAPARAFAQELELTPLLNGRPGNLAPELDICGTCLVLRARLRQGGSCNYKL